MIRDLKTKKYGTIYYLIDDRDSIFVDSLKLCISYVKQTDSFYIMTTNKKYLHRLLMKAEKGQEVDHINHNTLDNTRINLRLCNRKENRLNNKKFYTDTYKITKIQIKEIITSNLSNSKLAKIYGISNCIISKIKTGDMYSNVYPEIKRRAKQTKFGK